MKKISLILIISFFSILYPVKIYSSEFSVGIYPPKIEIQSAPGYNIETPINIQNFTDHEITFQILVKPFTASSNENGEISYSKPSKELFGANPDFLKNVQILDSKDIINELKLSPKQQKKIILKINIPKKEKFSDYYFSIVFMDKSNQANSNKGNNISQAIGGVATNILLSIGTDKNIKAQIEEFSTHFYIENGPVYLKLRVKNLSSHIIKPKGRIYITNMFGQRVGNIELLPVTILKQTIRSFPDISQKKAMPSPHIIWPEKLLFGFYTATVQISFSETVPISSKKVYFFAFPLKIFIGIITALLIVLLIQSRLEKTY